MNLDQYWIFNLKQPLFNQKEKTIKPFSFIMKPILEEGEISVTNIHDTIQLSSSPWLLQQLVVILDWIKLTKKNTHDLIYQEKLSNIQEKYPNYSHFCRDGPKDSKKIGFRAVFKNKICKKCLPKEASISTAETSKYNWQSTLSQQAIQKDPSSILIPSLYFYQSKIQKCITLQSSNF